MSGRPARAVWTGAGWMLLAGRVRPRLVAAGGLLTAVGFAALRRLAALYLPSLVASNQQQFGLLGVAFTLFSWLSACAFVIVVATVVGPSWPMILVASAGSSVPRGGRGSTCPHDLGRCAAHRSSTGHCLAHWAVAMA